MTSLQLSTGPGMAGPRRLQGRKSRERVRLMHDVDDEIGPAAPPLPPKGVGSDNRELCDQCAIRGNIEPTDE